MGQGACTALPGSDAGQCCRCAMPAGQLCAAVHARVTAKLRSEPLEDLRVDFEDGYPGTPEQEDAHALTAADVSSPITCKRAPSHCSCN